MDFLIPPDHDSRAWGSGNFEIVRAGKSYQEIDDFQKAALEAYLSERRAHEALRASPAVEAPKGIEPEERVYRPLNGEHEFRILEVYAGGFEASLHCKTHVCSIDFEYPFRPSEQSDLSLSEPRYRPHTHHAISLATGNPIWYTALSYVWGNSAFVKPVTCDGKPFKATLNLDLALRYLRRTDMSVMLWVDQICINQGDLNEKTQQVLLMGKIYRRAWNTLVWLGEEADNSSYAIDTILTINASLQSNTDETAPALEEFGRISLPAPGSQRWLDLSKLLSRPWFQRVWIIQETVLSADVQLQCGRRTISWLDMSTFAICMIQHDLTQYLVSTDNSADHLSEAGCIRIRMIDRMKDLNNVNPAKNPLLQALVEARGAQATDPRDKVFGIMEMAATTITPNYSKAVFEIYTEAARKNIPDRVFNLLCCVDHVLPSACCPSWVPDWSIPRETTSLGYLGALHGVYQAAKGSRPEIKQVGSGLFVAGIVYDTVSGISSPAESYLKRLPDPTSPTADFVIESVRMAMENCQPYPSNVGLFDTFWHTLVAGKDESGSMKAPSDFAEIFALLIDSAIGSSPSMPGQPTRKRRITLDNLKTRRPSRTYRQMQIAFEAAVKGRRFGTTWKRYMGLFPRGTRPGDQICILSGGHIPFVVRQWGTNGPFQLMGECYVHGIMDGEVMQMKDLKKEEIQLV
jgi:WD repeat-containing protein 55